MWRDLESWLGHETCTRITLMGNLEGYSGRYGEVMGKGELGEGGEGGMDAGEE